MLKKRVPIGIGGPQVFSFPSDPMRTVARRGKLCLHHPSLGVDAIDLARRRHGEPELAIPPLLAVSACARRRSAHDLSLLESTDHLLSRTLLSACRPLTLLCQRAAAGRRIAHHLINHARAGSEMP